MRIAWRDVIFGLLAAIAVGALVGGILSATGQLFGAAAATPAPTWRPTPTWVWQDWPVETTTPCPTWTFEPARPLPTWVIIVPTRRPTEDPTLAPLAMPDQTAWFAGATLVPPRATATPGVLPVR